MRSPCWAVKEKLHFYWEKLFCAEILQLFTPTVLPQLLVKYGVTTLALASGEEGGYGIPSTCNMSVSLLWFC